MYCGVPDAFMMLDERCTSASDERAMHAHRIPVPRHVKHVALPEQRFGAHLVEDRRESTLLATWNAIPRRNVRLDEPVMTSTDGVV